MAKLRIVSKPSDNNVLTLKQNYHVLQKEKYKSIMVSSICLNILLLTWIFLTTIYK